MIRVFNFSTGFSGLFGLIRADSGFSLIRVQSPDSSVIVFLFLFIDLFFFIDISYIHANLLLYVITHTMLYNNIIVYVRQLPVTRQPPRGSSE